MKIIRRVSIPQEVVHMNGVNLVAVALALLLANVWCKNRCHWTLRWSSLIAAILLAFEPAKALIGWVQALLHV